MWTLKHRFHRAISIIFVILCRHLWGIPTPLSLSRRD